jgi:dephospho-CoA kinase
VYRAITAGLRGFELTGEYPMAVVDVPLLYETGAEEKFDRVIATTCPEALQIERLRARGLSEEQARQRMAAQWPADRKAARADVVIRTDGLYEDTDKQVERALASLASGAS